jgi:hypothetical protein
MGGTNDEDNLIDLFAREHFEAHRLLALENPENDGLVYAWSCMAFFKGGTTSNRYATTSDEYEKARIELSCLQSKKKKGKYLGENNPNYNNHKLSGKNNPMYGKHHATKTKEIIGRKTKERLSNPENHPMYGRCHSDESKEKMANNRKKYPIICVETNMIYSSISKASKLTGIDKSSISNVCKEKCGYKTAGGYHWYYLYDQINKDGTIIQGAITLGLITEEDALKILNFQSI